MELTFTSHPESSLIKQVDYLTVSQLLRVEFHNGDSYTYETPVKTYWDLVSAKSAGGFYNKNIKGVYNRLQN